MMEMARVPLKIQKRKINFVILAVLLAASAWFSSRLYQASQAEKAVAMATGAVIASIEDMRGDSKIFNMRIGADKKSGSFQRYLQEPSGEFYWDSHVGVIWFEEETSTVKGAEINFGGEGKLRKITAPNIGKLLEETALEQTKISQLASGLSRAGKGKILASDVREFQLSMVTDESVKKKKQLLDLTIELDGTLAKKETNLTEALFPEVWESQGKE